MRDCEQTRGQSVLQHGLAVMSRFQELRKILGGEIPAPDWKFPEWFLGNREFLLANLLPEETCNNYQVHHDCGKPYCRVVDGEGRTHFPDHAGVSAKIFREVWGDEQAARLIEDDMAIHADTSEQIKEKLEARWTRREAVTLLLTALAEVHANAAMFGGTATGSFKAKWKRVAQRGRQILRHYNQL